MKKNFFLRYWPITGVMITMIISNLLLAAIVFAQPIDSDSTHALQTTPIASPVPQQTTVIPNTGDGREQIYFDIISRVPWLFMGMVLLFFLFFLMARSGSKHHNVER